MLNLLFNNANKWGLPIGDLRIAADMVRRGRRQHKRKPGRYQTVPFAMRRQES
jgi:hypothetical protein